MQIDESHDIKLKISQVGDPVLRKVARQLTKEEILDSSIQQLIAQMKMTVRDAPGVGLAAPQVGVSLQLVVIEDREEFIRLMRPEDVVARDRRPVPFHVIINPKISLLETEKQASFHEGCLSIAGYMGCVSRALKVKVEALNEKAESVEIVAQGWYARILQHEIDHLNGTLIIDRMDTKSFATLENYRKYPG